VTARVSRLAFVLVAMAAACSSPPTPTPGPSQAPAASLEACGAFDPVQPGSPEEAAHRFCFQVHWSDSVGFEQDVQVFGFADQVDAPLANRSVLIYHPGGPALSPVRMMAADAPLEYLDTHVVVAFDGTTASLTPGSCSPATSKFGTDRDPFDPAADARVVATDCLHGFGGPADIGAQRGAAELELVRQALGVEQVDLHMISYGTAIGEAYVRAHPDRVRRAAFDAPIAMEVPWGDRVSALDEVLRAAADELAAACVDGACGAIGNGGRLPTYRLLREAVLARDPAVGGGDLRLTAVMLDQATLLALRDPSAADAYADAVEAALGGDGTPLYAMGEKYFFDLDRNVFYRSICADIDRPSDARDYAVRGQELLSTWTSELAPCSGFPYRSLPEPARGGDPDVLIVASTRDVLTPASLLDSAPVLAGFGAICRTDQAGHTSSQNASVQAEIRAFLRGGGAAAAARCDALD
jgi:pimeloyl-ACP methyl ester carboxylesterase